jgi:hypothetical protein
MPSKNYLVENRDIIFRNTYQYFPLTVQLTPLQLSTGRHEMMSSVMITDAIRVPVAPSLCDRVARCNGMSVYYCCCYHVELS